MTTATLPMTRGEWLAQRKTGIGGSDAAAVLGLSKWATPLQVYLDKISNETNDFDSPSMKWGRILEPVIRQEYADHTGQEILKPQYELIRHQQCPFILASLDGFTADNRVVEIKTSKYDRDWGEEGTDQVPQEYLIQVQHYMAVTGFQIADIAVLIGGSDFRIYTVGADPELHLMMFEAYGAFWRRVTMQLPPEPTCESDMALYFKAKKKGVTTTDDVTKLVGQLKLVKKQIEGLEARESELKCQIMAYMGEHDTLLDVSEKPLVTWKEAKGRNTFDAKAFEKEHPDLHAKYLKTGEASRRFLIK